MIKPHSEYTRAKELLFGHVYCNGCLKDLGEKEEHAGVICTRWDDMHVCFQCYIKEVGEEQPSSVRLSLHLEKQNNNPDKKLPPPPQLNDNFHIYLPPS